MSAREKGIRAPTSYCNGPRAPEPLARSIECLLLLCLLRAAGTTTNRIQVAFTGSGERIVPSLAATQRARILGWWKRRVLLGKPLNLARLAKASTTFEGAARYAAWKIERHTGMAIEVTPFRERYPLLAAPGVLWDLRKHRRTHGRKQTP